MPTWLRPGRLLARAPKPSLPENIAYATRARQQVATTALALSFALAAFLVIAWEHLELSARSLGFSVIAATAAAALLPLRRTLISVPVGPAAVLPDNIPTRARRGLPGLLLNQGESEPRRREVSRIGGRTVFASALLVATSALSGNVLPAAAVITGMVVAETLTLIRIISWERANDATLLWVRGEDGEPVPCTRPAGSRWNLGL